VIIIETSCTTRARARWYDRAMARAWMVSLLVVLWACDRGGSAPSGRSVERNPSAAAASTARTADRAALPRELVRAQPDRVVAIGDLHGDLPATRAALRLAGAIDARDRWSGGRLVVVHTGDSIDRGPDDKAVLDLLDRLRDEARAAGGELILLSGNHELMNVAQDFRYVNPESDAAFGGTAERARAFLPGGSYARRVATRPLFVQVGDSVFVHGGILPEHVEYGLERMDREARAWARGEHSTVPEALASDDGPVWTRAYSDDPGSSDCTVLRDALARLGARRMVVGHTVQPNGISAACDGQVWRIDVGLSKHYGGTLQVLEIARGAPRVLTGERAEAEMGEQAPVAPPP
jgi:hypothetical protein